MKPSTTRLHAWKDAGEEMARFSKALEDQRARSWFGSRCCFALRAPTLAANVGKEMNNAATMGVTLKGMRAERPRMNIRRGWLIFMRRARKG